MLFLLLLRLLLAGGERALSDRMEIDCEGVGRQLSSGSKDIERLEARAAVAAAAVASSFLRGRVVPNMSTVKSSCMQYYSRAENLRCVSTATAVAVAIAATIAATATKNLSAS